MTKAIDYRNLPVKLPVSNTAIWIIAMDIYNAPQWFWGVSLTILVLAWIMYITARLNEDRIDIFKERDTNDSEIEQPIKKSFQERLDDAVRERMKKS